MAITCHLSAGPALERRTEMMHGRACRTPTTSLGKITKGQSAKTPSKTLNIKEL